MFITINTTNSNSFPDVIFSWISSLETFGDQPYFVVVTPPPPPFHPKIKDNSHQSE